MHEKPLALRNDDRIMNAAIYHETKGNTEEADETGVLGRFTEFKHLIKRGSFTVDSLEERTFERYGVVKEDPKTLKDSKKSQQPIDVNLVQKMFEDLKKRSEDNG